MPTPKIDPAEFDTIFQVTDKQDGQYVIRAFDVQKTYKMGNTETHALRGATLDIFKGEYLSIMGPSGSGKTTLFNMIGALAKPTAGKVYIDQVDIGHLDANELAWLRCRKIGYIFQTFNLIQVMTCLENVTLPMAYAGIALGATLLIATVLWLDGGSNGLAQDATGNLRDYRNFWQAVRDSSFTVVCMQTSTG